MNETVREFEPLLGHAALWLWSELPHEVQEKLFEAGVPLAHACHPAQVWIGPKDGPAKPAETLTQI